MSAIKKEDFDDLVEQFERYQEKESLVSDRIGEIIGLIARVCGVILDAWEFPDCTFSFSGIFDENETDIQYSFYGSSITQSETDNCLYGSSITQLETDNCSYGECFPKCFLFMSNDEIEKIITSQIEATKLKAEEKKRKRKAKKKEKNAKKKAILDKLTPEERSILGLK